MFESLTDRLQGVMQGLRGHGKLTAEDIEELVSNLDDLTVNVEGKETVRIYAE